MPRQVLFQPGPIADTRTGIAEFARDATSAAFNVQANRDKAEAESLASAFADIRVKTAELESEFSDDPVRFANAYDAHVKGASQVLSERVRDRYVEAAGREKALSLVKINEAAQARLLEQENVSRETAFNELTSQAMASARLGNLEFIEDARLDLQEILIAMQLNPGVIGDELRKFDSAMLREATLGEFEEAENKGEYMARYAERKDIPIDEQQSMLATMTGMVQQEKTNELLANAEQLQKDEFDRSIRNSNLRIGVSRGERGYEDIDRAFLAEDINEDERVSLYKELDKKVKSTADQALAMSAVHDAINGGAPLDRKNKHQMDALDLVMRQAGDYAELSSGGMDAVADLVEKTGVVPDSLRAHFRTHLRHSDHEIASQAADFYDRVALNSPEAVESIPKDERAFAQLVNDSISAGMDAERAVELTRERVYNVTSAERESRKSKYVEDFKSDNADFLEDEVTSFFSPDVPVAMQSEFDLLTEQYYSRTGEIESARNLAFRDLNGVWGDSEVTDSFMKYPPERMYDMPSDEMRAQLESELGELAESIGSNITLISDAQTARSPKNAASWPVVIIDENGMPELARDEDNMTLRWKPDLEAFSEARRAETQQKEAQRIAERKAVREKYQEAFGAPSP